MAIYNRWGSSLTIVKNCGPQKPKEFEFQSTLVAVTYNDGKAGFQFVDFLKADDGWPEIEKAVSSAEIAVLSADALGAAIKMAL